MITVTVRDVAVAGPGLPGWTQARPVLRGEAAWRDAPWSPPAPSRLPANERRRAPALIRLAFAVCEPLLEAHPLETVPTVFASSAGDYGIIDRICRTLLQDGRLVSPTLFHNTVHNAPAGYWHIALASRAPSTSLGAHDGSAAAGLVEAAAQVVTEKRPVLLVLADAPVPGPLHHHRPIRRPFAAALLLAPAGEPGPRLALRFAAGRIETPCCNPDLEPLRLDNPAARILPLLEALAAARPADIGLPLRGPGGLRVRLELAE